MPWLQLSVCAVDPQLERTVIARRVWYSLVIDTAGHRRLVIFLTHVHRAYMASAWMIETCRSHYDVLLALVTALPEMYICRNCARLQT